MKERGLEHDIMLVFQDIRSVVRQPAWEYGEMKVETRVYWGQGIGFEPGPRCRGVGPGGDALGP